MALSQRYKDYIRSKEWQAKRQECFAYHGKRCKACGKTSGPIHVHHLDYARLGNESAVHDLMPLCAQCHRSLTKIYKRNRRRGLRRVTNEYVTRKRALMKRKKQG